jgi:hypothetical protein
LTIVSPDQLEAFDGPHPPSLPLLSYLSHGSVDESRHELLGTFGTCHGLIRNPKPPLLGCVFPLANEGGGSSLSGLAEGKTVLVAGQGSGQRNIRLFFQLSTSIS